MIFSLFAPGRVRLAALCLAFGCADPDTPPAADADLAGPAGAALAELARDRFDIVAFVPSQPQERRFTDDNEWTVRLRAVPFVARVRLRHDLSVAGAEALGAQAGAIAHTPEDAATAEALLDTLGPGHWRAGSEVDVLARAVFEDAGARWRFRAFERGR